MNDPTPVPADLLAAEAAAWFPIHLKEWAARIFAQQGGLHPMAILIARRNPKTRFSFKRATLLPIGLALDSQESKGPLAEEVRKMARRSDAFAAGMMAEAWTTSGLSTDDYLRDGWQGRLGTHPNRVEVISVSWQHRLAGVGGALAEIFRGTGGAPVLGPWQPIPVTGGRMVEFLPEGEG